MTFTPVKEELLVNCKFEHHQWPYMISLSKKLYPQCLELVSARNRSESESISYKASITIEQNKLVQTNSFTSVHRTIFKLRNPLSLKQIMPDIFQI